MKKVIVIALAIVILAAGTFEAFNLFGKKPPAGQVLAATSQAGQKSGLTINLQAATEIPKTQPDLVGNLNERVNNSLMVKPQTKTSTSQDMPLTEVVITTDTKVYQDITAASMPPNPDPNTTYQQKVEIFNIDQLLPGDQIIAWGDLRGSRLVATIVVCNIKR